MLECGKNASIPFSGFISILEITENMLEEHGTRQLLASFEKSKSSDDDGGIRNMAKYCQVVSDFVKHLYNTGIIPVIIVQDELPSFSA